MQYTTKRESKKKGMKVRDNESDKVLDFNWKLDQGGHKACLLNSE